jgi:hypothetical protein
MAPPGKGLLASPAQLKGLPLETVRLVIELADRESQRNAAYAMVGMVCGTISFLGALSCCVYLVLHGHDTAAGLVFGTTAAAVVGHMIRGR